MGTMSKNNLSRYRGFLGLTQSEMADIFGITKQAYSQKERGITRFTQTEMIIIRDMINEVMPGTTIDDIFFS